MNEIIEPIIVYYYKKDGILKGLLNCVIGQEDHVLTPEELEKDPYKKELYKDTLLFEGTTPLMAGYPLEDDQKPGYVRLATRYELVKMGKDTLGEGEKLDDDNKEIVHVPKPNNFATWDSVGFVWTTVFESLPDGWKVVDRDAQKIQFIKSPNYAAKWDKVAQEWKTDVNDLLEGDRLLPNGTVEHVDKPMDDNQHKWAWNKVTSEWQNIITEEELKQNYFKIIEKCKADCINSGFMFRGYQQKCRILDMNWITQRMNQTRDDALAKDQINIKYELLEPHTKDDLMKVGWVFDHNEVLMLDILDFREMFMAGAAFTQSAYLVEELLKDGPVNFALTLEEFRAQVEKYSSVKTYAGPAVSSSPAPNNDPSRSLMRGAMFFRMPEEVNYEQEGIANNPAHKLGLRGSEVMLAAHYGLTLEEAAAKKQQVSTLEEKPVKQ